MIRETTGKKGKETQNERPQSPKTKTKKKTNFNSKLILRSDEIRAQ